MIKTTRLVPIEAYQDKETGKPVCWECALWLDCKEAEVFSYIAPPTPGPSCPVWHGESNGNVEADAARYRWLRNNASPGLFHPNFAAVYMWVWKTPGQIDEGVDLAMKAYPTQEKP